MVCFEPLSLCYDVSDNVVTGGAKEDIAELGATERNKVANEVFWYLLCSSFSSQYTIVDNFGLGSRRTRGLQNGWRSPRRRSRVRACRHYLVCTLKIEGSVRSEGSKGAYCSGASGWWNCTLFCRKAESFTVWSAGKTLRQRSGRKIWIRNAQTISKELELGIRNLL